jgi:predicted DNA-binding transcriptional regulator AlpA
LSFRVTTKPEKRTKLCASTPEAISMKLEQRIRRKRPWAITSRELALLLRVDLRTVHRQMKAGLLPKPTMLGKRMYFPVKELEVRFPGISENL